MKNWLLYFFAILLAVSVLPFAASKTVAAEEKPSVRVLTNGEITEMTVEDYVFRVMLAEGEICESLQTKKALAVAIRSCALYASVYGLKHDDYEFCDNVGCCMELGNPNITNAEFAEACQRAANETVGEVLLYEKQPALALFTLCGGSGTVGSEDFTYLTAVSENEKCEIHTYNLSADLNKIAIGAGACAEELKNNSCLVLGDNNKCEFGVFGGKMLSGEELSVLLGAYSKEFELKFKENTIEIKGIGGGHGYGLNLCGAERLAKQKFGYERILEIYFPKLKSAKIYE